MKLAGNEEMHVCQEEDKQERERHALSGESHVKGKFVFAQ
jgi:hypothetical protein